MQEVIVRLRDDLDNTVGDDIETHEFSFGGKNYEIDLSAANFVDFEEVMKDYVKAAREVKRRRRRNSNPKTVVTQGISSQRGSSQWASEITDWAFNHGYQPWDKETRNNIKAWANNHGYSAPRTGLLPRYTLEAHYAARQEAGVLWPT